MQFANTVLISLSHHSHITTEHIQGAHVLATMLPQSYMLACSDKFTCQRAVEKWK
jgi:hypothetical protein